MKLKTSVIRKLSLLSLGCLVISACDRPKTAEVVQAKIGLSLDTLITQWGFPTSERHIAGRDLLVWEQQRLSYEDVPSLEISWPSDDRGSVGIDIPLTDPEVLTCHRIVQVDANNIVVAAATEGNDCRYYAPRGW